MNPDSVVGTYLLTFNDEAGNTISTQAITLSAHQHISFSIGSRYPELTGKRGFLDIVRVFASAAPKVRTYPYMSVIAIHFNPSGSLSWLPMLGLVP